MLVGGLVAFGAYKMSTRDADRIEEYTGMPPEDLEDQDLEEAMDALNIPKESVDESDREAADAGGEGGGTAAPATPATDPLDQIKKLADLHAQGILTDEEFETKKTELLGEL